VTAAPLSKNAPTGTTPPHARSGLTARARQPHPPTEPQHLTREHRAPERPLGDGPLRPRHGSPVRISAESERLSFLMIPQQKGAATDDR